SGVTQEETVPFRDAAPAGGPNPAAPAQDDIVAVAQATAARAGDASDIEARARAAARVAKGQSPAVAFEPQAGRRWLVLLLLISLILAGVFAAYLVANG